MGKAFYRFSSSYLHLYGLPVDTCTSTLFDKLHASVTHLPRAMNMHAEGGKKKKFSYQSAHSRDSTTFFLFFFFFTFYFLCVFCRLCLKKEAPRSANYHFNCLFVYLFIYYSQAWFSFHGPFIRPSSPLLLTIPNHCFLTLVWERRGQAGGEGGEEERKMAGILLVCLSFCLFVCLIFVWSEWPFKKKVPIQVPSSNVM